MAMFDVTELSWAITKAVLILISCLAALGYLLRIALKKDLLK